MPRELVCCSVGQCGIQISNAVWELICLEHGVSPDGTSHLSETAAATDSLDNINCLFHTSATGNYVPRTLITDLEPTVVDEIRTGMYRSLFHPDCLVNGIEDAANNFARGKLTHGREMISKVMNQIRRLVEDCEMFAGFFIMHSAGGGTGAGLTDLLLESLNVRYGKKDKINGQIIPGGKTSSTIVDPYNIVLGVRGLTEMADVVLQFENEAIYNLCTRLRCRQPSFTHLNRVISQVVSDLTASYRFENSLTTDLITLQTNMVPYPRIHFMCPSRAPLISHETMYHTLCRVKELTRDAFLPDCLLVEAELRKGYLMSCSLIYRGQVASAEVNQALLDLKCSGDLPKFVDWNPTGFKVSLNSRPATVPQGALLAPCDKNVTLLANSTAINALWTNVKNRYEKLFTKRAFVHWFVGEGMEEGELSEALSNMNQLIKDYQELGGTDAGDEPPNPSEATRSLKTSDKLTTHSAETKEARNSDYNLQEQSSAEGNQNGDLAEDSSPLVNQQDDEFSPRENQTEEELGPSAEQQEEEFSPSAEQQEEEFSPSAEQQEEEFSPSAEQQEEELSPSAEKQEEELSPSAENQDGEFSPSAEHQEEEYSPQEEKVSPGGQVDENIDQNAAEVAINVPPSVDTTKTLTNALTSPSSSDVAEEEDDEDDDEEEMLKAGESQNNKVRMRQQSNSVHLSKKGATSQKGDSTLKTENAVIVRMNQSRTLGQSIASIYHSGSSQTLKALTSKRVSSFIARSRPSMVDLARMINLERLS